MYPDCTMQAANLLHQPMPLSVAAEISVRHTLCGEERQFFWHFFYGAPFGASHLFSLGEWGQVLKYDIWMVGHSKIYSSTVSEMTTTATGCEK